MRKSTLSIADARNKINELVGRNIRMEVCRGRKKVTKFNGIMVSTLPSIFVVKLTDRNATSAEISYSYNDYICGEVTIQEVAN